MYGRLPCTINEVHDQIVGLAQRAGLIKDRSRGCGETHGEESPNDDLMEMKQNNQQVNKKTIKIMIYNKRFIRRF